MTVNEAISKYDAAGSWWSYEKDAVPDDVKIEISTSIKQFDKEAEKILSDRYTACKPRPDSYRSIKDWGF